MNDLMRAIFNVQKGVSAIKTDSKNPMYQGKKYATLKQIMAVVKPLMEENNLVFTSCFDYRNEQWGLLSSLVHIPEKTDVTMLAKIEAFFPMEKIADPQQLGKLATYARRYNLTSLLNLTFEDDDDDDDGNSFVKAKVTKTKPTPLKL